ncbi:PLP-dependent aminotransferase family protein [Streptomyces sp. WI04-05B]|uniref:aminotransferase-like domain-containing protein n=1 Tax=Streptomyces TaxID=1883 RepID=UPI0029B350DC|nr:MULTISPECIES: PLP-dependent aminotransferase family protein [unclassified Streptomyces]MDX2547633.1 PLP-dependent aminotransferase family protein [Streptomyces sp. WI04-05B]MDX2590111.1 PLP-dependent aminotransferase family protein [Streptomyces sp. WI04-05A]MDX3752847.1 PLP-dependent aminotransferase family protein [Streptomyces sp. AK08-02]
MNRLQEPAISAPPSRPGQVTLCVSELHGSLGDPVLESMNFLNEVSHRFPDALSLAAGRPYEGLFDVEDIHRYLRTFHEHLSGTLGWPEERVRRTIFQYGRTKGIIHDLIARNLAIDEDIHVDPESIVVTVGCQEAMFLVLRALRTDEHDVLLAVAPTYVGITGAARLADLPVLPVNSGPGGIDLTDLAQTVHGARAQGLRPRALYVIPDFSNPLGVSLDTATRQGLLELADELDLLLLEDNPYGLFFAGERLATLKSMDRQRRVVYLGSFAKSALPGARVGYLVADQRVTAEGGGELGFLADQLSRIKSMLTVNTSPVAQAVIGGKLLTHGGSLAKANARETEVYRRNLRLLLQGLEKRFPQEGGDSDVTWNIPSGGFFLVLTVPFAVDDALLEHSARRHGVIWTPMHHFFTGRTSSRQMRLSYSQLEPEQIDDALDRLAALIHEQRVLGAA